VDRAFLEAQALRYLDRFDATRQRLGRVLMDKARQALAGQGDDAKLAQVRETIDSVLERLGELGVLDDRRFAEHLLETLRRRGLSERAINARLRARGVQAELVVVLLQREAGGEEDVELAAARRLVARRKLGGFRPPDERAAMHHRDLAKLARAGFDFDTAARALAYEPDE
jgi:regulatory protein